jgi:hypothetical protein
MELQKLLEKIRGLQITIQAHTLKIASCKTAWEKRKEEKRLKSYILRVKLTRLPSCTSKILVEKKGKPYGSP